MVDVAAGSLKRLFGVITTSGLTVAWCVCRLRRWKY
jgi:hypothetical protein